MFPDLSGHDLRERRSRVVTSISLIVYTVSAVGVGALQRQILSGVDLVGSRDVFYLGNFTAVFIGVLLIGLPGRTLHHYPGEAGIRRGQPRWWKGAASTAALVGLIIAANELLARPRLQYRARLGWPHTPEEIQAAIEASMAVSYWGAALVIVWVAIAALLGPQLMSRPQRRRLTRSLLR